MKNFKLFIIQVVLFSCLIFNNSFSKALPPGSGVADVPANVLILLDKWCKHWDTKNNHTNH